MSYTLKFSIINNPEDMIVDPFTDEEGKLGCRTLVGLILQSDATEIVPAGKDTLPWDQSRHKHVWALRAIANGSDEDALERAVTALFMLAIDAPPSVVSAIRETDVEPLRGAYGTRWRELNSGRAV